MNNYRQFKNYEYKSYDRIETRSQKVIYRQVNAYLKYCALTRQMSSMTMRAKRGTYEMLIRESACSDLRNFTNHHLDKFIGTEIGRGVSARTVNTKIAHVVALVKYYREMGMEIPLRIPLVPKLKELPPRRTCYTREQIDEVLSGCDSEFQWLVIKIAFDTGMRITELTNLTVDEINGRQIRFIGKGGKAREVYIGDETSKRLTEYLRDNGISTGRVWLNDWRYPTSSDTIRRTMREAFFKKGYTDFYPHALRHSFGSDLQRQGADVMVIKEMMGHSNIATTQKYLHGLDGKLKSLFDMYKN